MTIEEPADVPPRSGGGSRGGRGLIYLGKLLLILLAVYLAVRVLEGIRWADLDARLSAARWRWLGLAVALMATRPAVWAARWGLAVGRTGGPVRRLAMVTALAAAMAVNHLTPGARVLGGFFRARWMMRWERGGRLGSFGAVFGTVLFDQFAHQVVTGGATVAALVAGLVLLGRPAAAAGLLLATLAVGAGLLLWSRRRGEGGLTALIRYLTPRAARATGRLQRLFAHSRDAVEMVGHLAGDRGLWYRCLVLGVVFVVLNVLAQWAVFASLGLPASLTLSFLGVALGATAGILLGTPGGAGATEAAMIACYVALGLDRLDATAGTLLFRGLHYATILSLGLPAIGVLELRRGRRVESREVETGSRPWATEGKGREVQEEVR